MKLNGRKSSKPTASEEARPTDAPPRESPRDAQMEPIDGQRQDELMVGNWRIQFI
jgi:hypothetical protein